MQPNFSEPTRSFWLENSVSFLRMTPESNSGKLLIYMLLLLGQTPFFTVQHCRSAHISHLFISVLCLFAPSVCSHLDFFM